MAEESELINSVAVKGYHGVLTKAQWPALRAALITKYKERLFTFPENGSFKPEATVDSFRRTIEEMVLPPFTLQRICELLLDDTTYTVWERYTFAMAKVRRYNEKGGKGE